MKSTHLLMVGAAAILIAAPAQAREGQPHVPTDDGVREPQNRRVEVTYGPGSGM